MKYIVWIAGSKWTVKADNVEIVLCAIISGLRTNAHVDFYEGATDEEVEKARFRNTSDFKIFTPKKQKEYIKFMQTNKGKIIEAIQTITDLEKEIIDDTEKLLDSMMRKEKFFDWEEMLRILDQINKLKARKDLITQENDTNTESEPKTETELQG